MNSSCIVEIATNMTNNPTICIPKINNTITKYDIQSVFKKLNIGEIQDIRFVGKYSKTAYIKIERWYEKAHALEFRERLIEEKPINVVYNFPWFWKCVKARE